MLKKDRRGFTILEVAVIIVLMGLIGVIAVPSVGLIHKQEVKKLAKEMCLDLTTQRIKAMSMGTNHFVELTGEDTSGYNYDYQLSFLKKDSTPLEIVLIDKKRDNSKNIHITMQTSRGEAEVIATPTKIQFDHYGYMMDTGTSEKDIYELTISIKYDNAEAIITFDGITGHYTNTIH